MVQWLRIHLLGFPGGSAVKNMPANASRQETRVQSLGQKDPLEKEMATHSSILAWRIPCKNTGVGCHFLLQKFVRLLIAI